MCSGVQVELNTKVFRALRCTIIGEHNCKFIPTVRYISICCDCWKQYCLDIHAKDVGNYVEEDDLVAAEIENVSLVASQQVSSVISCHSGRC